MQYPQYPLKETRKAEGLPKDPIREQMRTWRLFTDLGLLVLPKRRDDKFPVGSWKKYDTISFTEAQNIQSLDHVSGWCVVTGEKSGRLLVIDLDTNELVNNGKDPFALYNKIQNLCPTQFVLGTPSFGVHLYYRIPETREMFTNGAKDGFDIRGEGGQVVTLHGYNRYDGEYAEKKGLEQGHCHSYFKLGVGSDYSSIPEMNDQLYDFVQEWHEKKPKPTNPKDSEGEAYARNPLVQRRIEEHLKQDDNDRDRIVIECLSKILQGFDENTSYDLWFQTWASAHHGSQGSSLVRDYIISHPDVYWSDGEEGRLTFRDYIWENHEYRENGYTVASLFWLARKGGWLQEAYELREHYAETINVKYITEWLNTVDRIPTRLLLKSQTGSGKTYAIKWLFDALSPKRSVIFVPTNKLAIELSGTLRQRGVENTLYVDDTTSQIREVEELLTASVLVTTMHTFINRVYKHLTMAEFDFVYFEEADQLIQQFSLGGNNHVTDYQARTGFEVIKDALNHSGFVWFVDATMTHATYVACELLNEGRPIKVIINKLVSKKAPVTMTNEEGLALQAVLRGLEKGKRVVACCDTKSKAMMVYDMMGVFGYESRILITGDTKQYPEVADFMRDVNKGAEKYDLVCYSPVMSSGVSISEVNADLVVQFCEHLTPRKNLQMLNRYRQQSDVVCFYRYTENLYGKDAETYLNEMQERAMIEAHEVRVPLLPRTQLAMARSEVASISVGDTYIQQRSPIEFYEALLVNDGREVDWMEVGLVTAQVARATDVLKEVREQRKELIASTWRQQPPLDRRNGEIPEDVTDLLRAEAHAYIERVLLGNVPPDTGNDAEVYRICQELGRHSYRLDAIFNQRTIVEKAERYLMDNGQALVSLHNNVTLLKVVSATKIVFDNLTDEVHKDDTAKLSAFLDRIHEIKDEYNASMRRTRDQYEHVVTRTADDMNKRGLAFLKIILSKVGAKLRMERGSMVNGEYQRYAHIENVDDILQFLAWRNSSSEFHLDNREALDYINSRKDESKRLQEMTENEQLRVFKLMDTGMTLKDSVHMVERGLQETEGW